MGALIPNGFDQEIILKLNTIFSGATFDALKGAKDADGHDPFSEGGTSRPKRLSRAARRVGAYPDKKAHGGKKPRARWYVFLDKLKDLYDIGVDPSNPGSARSTETTIKKLISDALNDSWNGNSYTTRGGIKGIVFGVGYEAPTSLFEKSESEYGLSKTAQPPTAYVEPNNDPQEPENSPPGHLYELPEASGGGWILSINLIVQDYMNAYGVDPKPNHPNEKAKDNDGNDIENALPHLIWGEDPYNQ